MSGLLEELVDHSWVIEVAGGLESVAAHESAHAVVAHHLGWDVDSISLDPPRTLVNASAGMTKYDLLWEKLVIVHAGRAADLARHSERHPWSFDDLCESLHLSQELQTLTGREQLELREQAQSAAEHLVQVLARRHQAVTTHLLRCARLSGEEVAQIP